MLVLHFILIATLSAGNESITRVLLAFSALSKSLFLRACEDLVS